MNTHEPTQNLQSPLQRVIVFAGIACFVSSLVFYWVARPVVEMLEARWTELVVYAIFPMAVTFIFLHRSFWRQEMTGAKRTCSLVLLSCLIFAGVLLAMGVMAFVVWFCSIAIPVGTGVR
jgi:hypothetical protein